jgi:hypothetical protein
MLGTIQEKTSLIAEYEMIQMRCKCRKFKIRLSLHHNNFSSILM